MENLKSWQKGQSGNPNGRPKGSKNVGSLVKQYLDDTKTLDRIGRLDLDRGSSTPIELIVYKVIDQALDGDYRSIQLLLDRYETQESAERLKVQPLVVSDIKPR